MDRVMRLALVAPSNVGKTSFLTALRQQLSRCVSRPIGEAPLAFEFTDLAQDSFLNQNLRLLYENKRLEGTAGVVTYPLKISVRNGDGIVSGIELVDFEGKHLQGAGTDVEHSLKTLANCDAFIILIDADHASEDGDYFEYLTASAKIAETLEKMLLAKRDSGYALHGVPFMFAISKYDLIKDNRALIEQLHTNIKEAFKGCFDDQHGAVTMLSHVSVGTNIDGSVPGIRGTYKPVNIMLTFLLTTAIGILSGAKARNIQKVMLDDPKRRAVDFHKREVEAAQQAQNNVDSWDRNDIIGKAIMWFDESGSQRRERLIRYQQDERKAREKVDEWNSKIAAEDKASKELQFIGRAMLQQLDKNDLNSNEAQVIIQKLGMRQKIDYTALNNGENPLRRWDSND